MRQEKNGKRYKHPRKLKGWVVVQGRGMFWSSFAMTKAMAISYVTTRRQRDWEELSAIGLEVVRATLTEDR